MTHPPVRTFKPRRRRLTATRRIQLERLAPAWSLTETGPPLDPVAVFGRSAPLVLDVGIGIGDAALAAALAEPGVDVIGVDVHTPGIAATLAGIETAQLANLRVTHGDALVFLARIRPDTLSGVRIFFPDPWPKARHRHRRLVRAETVGRLVDRLRPGGWLHLATDVDDYARQIERVCGAHPALHGGPVSRPAGRPLTRYERRALAAGHDIVDLWYRRT